MLSEIKSGSPGVGAEESSRSAVSWAAAIAGAVVASALSILLIALGSGLGLGSLSFWSNSGVSATTFGSLAVAWFVAIQLFASGVGGYIAGRLRTRWVGVHTDEVFFRDTAHGFLVWAVGTIITAGLLISVVSSAATSGAHISGMALQGTGSTNRTGATAYFTDTLFRSDHPAVQGDEATRAEVGRIFAKAIGDGDLNPADKTYVAQVVTRQTGLSQADAEKRVTDVVAQAKAAAEAARKITVYASLWAFIALLIGAFSASYMATIGGRLRDDLPAMG